MKMANRNIALRGFVPIAPMHGHNAALRRNGKTARTKARAHNRVLPKIRLGNKIFTDIGAQW